MTGQVAASQTHASVACNDWRKFISALSVFGRAAVVATLIGRTYAVCSRNRLVLGYLVVLGTTCVIADAFHVSSEKCVDTSDPPLATLLRWVFTIAFETSVAAITTIRTFQALRVGGPWRSQKHRLVYLVFEEGILYFCSISILTIASVILDVRAPTGFLQRFLDGLTLPLSGALTARFILHLRAWRFRQSGVHVISNAQRPRNSKGSLNPRFFHIRGHNASESVDFAHFVANTQQPREQQRPEANSNIHPFRLPGYSASGNVDLNLAGHSSTVKEFGEDPVVRAMRN
ncbi:hypothetical protein GYMLUDRAFT_260973 [Collybiopsis luxurians FD-317 M1]|uniref:Uncharacterized protein n=1 Tax=Collybiopsis luxurians FD-317 M1 TaxID=944289 RepID=A0A0D0BB89_9AGAR|nr:hypothetical protein GYMLUDRAFT_260973 [Collybiopsis luxurians FD-317 M1]